jgi:hypothetical protein
MSVATTISKIDSVSLQYAPQVLAAVTTLQAVDLPGQTKQQLAIGYVLAGAHIAEGVPVPSVAGIAALIDLFVSILQASGIFKRKAAPVVPVAPAPVQVQSGTSGIPQIP